MKYYTCSTCNARLNVGPYGLPDPRAVFPFGLYLYHRPCMDVDMFPPRGRLIPSTIMTEQESAYAEEQKGGSG